MSEWAVNVDASRSIKVELIGDYTVRFRFPNGDIVQLEISVEAHEKAKNFDKLLAIVWKFCEKMPITTSLEKELRENGFAPHCSTCIHGPLIPDQYNIGSCNRFTMADQCYEHGYGSYQPKEGSR